MKIGDKVTWQTLFGSTLAGTIEDVLYDRYAIRRIDGGLCTVSKARCKPATSEDIDRAIAVFSPSDRIP